MPQYYSFEKAIQSTPQFYESYFNPNSLIAAGHLYWPASCSVDVEMLLDYCNAEQTAISNLAPSICKIGYNIGIRVPIGMSRKPSQETSYVILALSYRGYWKSSGRATQSGIEKDAQAFLDWVSKIYSAPDKDCQIFLWGHSLGAAVASSALGTHMEKLEAEHLEGSYGLIPISGLILEAPISSIKDMLIGLYPQKWLPYRYLWPFSWNTWCTATSLERLASWSQRTSAENTKVSNESSISTRQSVPPILILSAEKDEVIPSHVGGQLESVCRARGLDIEHTNVPGAMHTECSVKNVGKEALMRFILDTGKSRRSYHMQAKNVRM
ncbi:uncharacterized protein N7483_012807 [Penicillium malachiteum]|uniref:uncharacterized protein n=1 Tax=Penicillium malachiteum TaxID=1324776 RepID=UPI00254944AD|nr:uncharacterized protein N7483_012807 [Penicillium malachiteum]KAJ5715626.1 hypothetical protein N7483_012807 [Penicillium malachiteum]